MKLHKYIITVLHWYARFMKYPLPGYQVNNARPQ
jgi:hypothetical protein